MINEGRDPGGAIVGTEQAAAPAARAIAAGPPQRKCRNEEPWVVRAILIYPGGQLAPLASRHQSGLFVNTTSSTPVARRTVPVQRSGEMCSRRTMRERSV